MATAEEKSGCMTNLMVTVMQWKKKPHLQSHLHEDDNSAGRDDTASWLYANVELHFTTVARYIAIVQW